MEDARESNAYHQSSEFRHLPTISCHHCVLHFHFSVLQHTSRARKKQASKSSQTQMIEFSFYEEDCDYYEMDTMCLLKCLTREIRSALISPIIVNVTRVGKAGGV